ncbi:MAG: hypothetical protein LUQ07_01885 [Methanospirillum sp.]|nr:hypothetical protein [Methanospirillum sp.]
MTQKMMISAVFLIMMVIFSIAGYAGAQPDSPPDMPPGASPSGGMQPGGSQASLSYNLSGAFTVGGEQVYETGKEYTSDTTDLSAVYVTDGGSLTLTNPQIHTSGNTSSNDASSFYGLNGAVLANDESTVVINGGVISTSGTGANGAIPTGEGTSITLSDLNITATGDGGHGVMATLGGRLTLDNVNISTTGKNSAPIATDRGSGTITVTGGTVTSSGADSPGIYSTGAISIFDATITSIGTEAAVIEGVNSISLQDTALSGGVEKTGGVMIYQSFSGDAEVGTGTFEMNGGSLTATEGPLFFVTNTRAKINLTRVAVVSHSGALIDAAATSRWGKTGENGGHVIFNADGEDLEGSVFADENSDVSVHLTGGSTLSGSVNSSALFLDPSSTWNVTADSVLTSLSDPEGVSGTSVMNIIGNGYNVTYNSTLGENSWLGGKTFTLEQGGRLMPE